MNTILDRVNKPEDLKILSIKEKKQLAEDIRKMLLQVVSKNGGHLSSNLGVVELTVALHSVFSTPKDRIVWDVGHQSYVHKILTGRKKEMDSLRKFGGIAGFPKVNESEYDCFNTGHSSTSISVAMGMARARDLLNENYRVIAVIGDGSLTGGMALEALNDVGASNTNVTIILNDNEMSISKNVGGIPLLLSKVRTRKGYTKTNKKIKDFTTKIPLIGRPFVKLVQKIKRGIKQLFIQNMYFEDIGFTYLWPVDGHNIEDLESIFKRSIEIDGPVLIHTITKKGKGYKFAEDNPDKFHGASSFNIETGKSLKEKTIDYSKVFGDKLVEIAEKNKKVVAVTAAMKDGTGLTEFAEKFPDRFFDVGIAEQHAVGLIAGMASVGLKPVFAVYSSFLQRSYDQIIHDIAIQKLPVVICLDRAGIVGNDGETHQGIFDISFLSGIPNLTILAPKDFKEFEKMLEYAVEFDGPIVIRYPRGSEGKIIYQASENIEFSKGEILRKGKDLTIVSIGKMVNKAMEIADILEKTHNISSEVINARFAKPLDEELILKSIKENKKVITIEDGILKGGFGDEIIKLCNKNNLNVKIQTFGYDDCFVEHGSVEELENKYISNEMIIKKIMKEFWKYYIRCRGKSWLAQGRSRPTPTLKHFIEKIFFIIYNTKYLRCKNI